MRITKNVMMSNMLSSIKKIESQVLKSQMQISSNSRILVPSDDPIGTSQALIARTALSKNEQYQNNVVSSRNWLELTESSINQVYDVLSEVEVLANTSAGDIYGDSERHGASLQFNRLLENIVQNSKTTFDGKYIFGGLNTNTEPFVESNLVENESFTAQQDADVWLDNVHVQSGTVVVTDRNGSRTFVEGVDYTIDYQDGSIKVLSSGSMIDGEEYKISYTTETINSVTANSNGVGGKISRQLGEDVLMDVNVSGQELFDDDINIFDMLIDLKKMVERDDTEGVRNKIDDIQSVLNHVANKNGDVGARLNRLDLTTDFLEQENVNLLDYKSSKEEVNVTEATIKFQSLSLAYQQALVTSSEILKSNLMNYLG